MNDRTDIIKAEALASRAVSLAQEALATYADTPEVLAAYFKLIDIGEANVLANAARSALATYIRDHRDFGTDTFDSSPFAHISYSYFSPASIALSRLSECAASDKARAVFREASEALVKAYNTVLTIYSQR